LRLACCIHTHDAVVTQVGHCAGLAKKALAVERIGSELVCYNLDGDVSLQSAVATEPNGSHPAHSKQPDDLVLARQCLAQSSVGLVNWARSHSEGKNGASRHGRRLSVVRRKCTVSDHTGSPNSKYRAAGVNRV